MRFLLYYFFITFMCLYLYIYISALPDPTCNSEKSANGGNKQILLLLLLLLLLLCIEMKVNGYIDESK